MGLGVFVVVAVKEKTHDCCQPWALAEIASSATRPRGTVTSDDDQSFNLQRRRIHQLER
jgi:hypothetical protein